MISHPQLRTLPVHMKSVWEAAYLTQSITLRTPVKVSERLSKLASASIKSDEAAYTAAPSIELFFKCENLQRTSSFKFRGSTHFLARLTNEELRKGVVAYSTGNHAQAVALAAKLEARRRGFYIPVHVVVPATSAAFKVQAAREYGATVVFSGTEPNHRVKIASEIQQSTGAVMVPPSDHPNIVAGQATAMVEFNQQMEAAGWGPLDAVIMPSGGGGLLAGAAIVCKGTSVRVFGAEPLDGGAALARGIEQNERIDCIGSYETIADGLRSPVGKGNWNILKDPRYVEKVYTVTDRQIKDAMRLIIDGMGLLIEPSAAVPLAAVLYNNSFHKRLVREGRDWKIGVILSGGSITVEKIANIFAL